MNTDQIQKQIEQAEASVKAGTAQLETLRKQLEDSKEKRITELHIGDVFLPRGQRMVKLLAVQIANNVDQWTLFGCFDDLTPWGVSELDYKPVTKHELLKYLNRHKSVLAGNINKDVAAILNSLRAP